MLVTGQVIPLGQNEVPEELDTDLTRTCKVALYENSVFLLAKDRGEDPPDVLRIFRLVEFSVHGSRFKWVVRDDKDRQFDGMHQPVRLTDQLTMQPIFPLVMTLGEYGFKVVWEFKAPKKYRVHHLSYVKKRWPEVIGRTF